MLQNFLRVTNIFVCYFALYSWSFMYNTICYIIFSESRVLHTEEKLPEIADSRCRSRCAIKHLAYWNLETVCEPCWFVRHTPRLWSLVLNLSMLRVSLSHGVAGPRTTPRQYQTPHFDQRHWWKKSNPCGAVALHNQRRHLHPLEVTPVTGTLWAFSRGGWWWVRHGGTPHPPSGTHIIS